MSSVKSQRNARAEITRSCSHPLTRVQSDALLGTAKELVIVHTGREYRLRKTQSGKLILTA